MKYYFIAGEASGDKYGALLMSQLRSLDASAQFRFWGGENMAKESSGQLKSIKETSFMGFIEVAKNLPRIRTFFSFAKFSIKEFKPDIVIFIDYPGFNLRMMKWAKEKGFRTCFYISPQLWAWKEKRHKILRSYADLFYSILPFEEEFYRNLDTPCTYVGHPLLELIQEPEKEISDQVKTVGLFPGSREQEISKHLPTLLSFAELNPNYHFIIACTTHLPRSTYESYLNSNIDNVKLNYNGLEDVANKIQFAITSSGTATLELALYQVPQIVIYKTSQVSFMIAKRLVKTKYISLVNLIANKEVVPELLQESCNELAINESFQSSLGIKARTRMVLDYRSLRTQLGDGTSSIKVARGIINFLSKEES